MTVNPARNLLRFYIPQSLAIGVVASVLIACPGKRADGVDSGRVADSGMPLVDGQAVACSNAPALVPVSAASAAGRLWLVSNDGQLSSFDATLETYRVHLKGHRVIAVRRARDSSLWALTVAEGKFAVYRWTAESWQLAFEVSGPKPKRIHGFSEIRGRPVIAWDNQVAMLGADGRTLVQAGSSEESEDSSLAVEATDEGDVYLGVDKGEWGGGLKRIRFDQVDAAIESSTSLDGRVDPVVQLVPDPESRGCAYGAVDLKHVGTRGRVFRVCGGALTTIFQRRADAGGGTIPVRALAAAPGVVFAVTDNAVYEIRGVHEVKVVPLVPSTSCGLTVTRIPGLWIVVGSGGRLVAVAAP